MRVVAWAALALAACSTPAPRSDVVARPEVVAVDATPGPLVISVTGLNPPKGFALDGDLGEWASLDAPADPQPPPMPPKDRWSDAHPDRKPAPQGPNPRSARSKLGIAVGRDAVLLAASLERRAADGLWVGIATWVPEVAPIGQYSRGGMTHEIDCEHEQISLAEGDWKDGPPLPPETAAACRELVARNDALVAKHRARFSKLFRLDRTGIQAVVGDALVAVEGAKTKAIERPDGTVTLEVSMPLAALPRLSDAPLDSLRMVARSAALPKPPHVEGDPWVWVRLPLGVHFEPYADLRERAFRVVGIGTYFPAGLSYDATTPDRIETIHYPRGERDRLEVSDEVLYEKKQTMGDVEVGLLHAYGTWLAVSKAGRLLDVLEHADAGPLEMVDPPELRAVVERDGELLAIFFQEAPLIGGWGVESPRWLGFAIAQDGTHRGAIVDDSLDIFRWTEVKESASPDYTTLTLRGTTYLPDGLGEPAPNDVGVELTWRWDPKRRIYAETKRTIPVPRSPRRRGK